ncbi:DUF2946 family protein [Azospirillum sp. HJ39]|uniref:DUF2946 family protein n=1 Tax=Azospirillum sp. HJ39 TaxID=3159496 RepID=UPI003556C71D
MTRRRTSRDRRDPPPGGIPGAGGRLRHALAGWLAVLALLVQVAVPDLAMAARAQAGLPAGFLTAATAAGHCGPDQEQHGGQHGGHPGEHPGGQGMDHGSLCAFCLALATHGLVPIAAAPPPRAVFASEASPPASPGMRPADHFLTCVKPRAPPV